MALTPARWISLALLAFLFAPVLIFRSHDQQTYQYTHRDRLQARAGRAIQRARTAAERARTDRLADSIRATMSGAPANTARVLFDRSLDSASRRMLSELADHATRKRPAQPRVITDIAFVMDTARFIGGIERRGFSGALLTNYILPQPATGGRCVVIARVRPWGANEFRSDVSRERLLGPCAFYEAFGAPGRGIATWLSNGGWSLAQSNWQLGPSSLRSPWRNGGNVPLRDLMGMRGVSCASGSDSACAAAFQNTKADNVSWRNGVLVVSYNPFIMSSGWYTRNWDFGMKSPALLADMVMDLGPDRFSRFWQSDLKPVAAFQSAAGQSLPEWTRGWLRRVYHAEQTGAGFSAPELVWGAVVFALALGVILRTAERRQMA